MKIELFRVIVPVTDIERAADFYAAMFDHPGTRVSPGRHYFTTGSTIFACYDAVADGDDQEPAANTVTLYLSVDDIKAALARVDNLGVQLPTQELEGVGVPGRIERRPWGEVSFYFEDPFGNQLCMVREDTVFVG